ncbi:uncharacterized protein C17orf67 homolog isoform X2 [Lepus europaeus]|uniref:uncharacterized protein C17orf67 homolog isoform X2 n=1 Tax=Lepus europaeus TaxID=9983 RepID=UPI002B46FD41|nr:uncharacterized protein C17orf67 homolog isoform X2 [Lepus europaeus]
MALDPRCPPGRHQPPAALSSGTLRRLVHPSWEDSLSDRGHRTLCRMKMFLLLLITGLIFCSEASPLLLTEKQAKQLLRSRRQEWPRKAGFRDEPMREYMLHLLALEHRAEEQFLEHWLNPHSSIMIGNGLDNAKTG